MRTSFVIVIAAAQLLLYGCNDVVTIEVCNPLDSNRLPELVEVNLTQVQEWLEIDNEDFTIRRDSNELPYQITHDGKVVFPVELEALETARFHISKGTPEKVITKVRGDHYPQRVDDICWENDKVGFRVYGFKEDNPSGYDIFTKKNTDLPVIPEMYRKAMDPHLKSLREQIRKTDSDSAERFNIAHMSFHVDHGYGADFYAVGHTLGAGTSALLDGDEIVYPFCYDTFEILDNGPLRFTLRLTFRPFKIGNCDEVVETRVISLDLGSHFNKTTVTFDNLDRPVPVVTGIVVQDKDGKAVGNAEKGYITYPAPTMNFDKFKDVDNGTIYIGNVFPYALDDASLKYFPEQELEKRGGAKGHILARSTYTPDKPFSYYWGFGWDGSDMPSYKEWLDHVEAFSTQLRTPVIINFN